MIEKVYITECGYCVNDLGKIYKGHKKEKVNFPANCVVIKHSTKGWILFDTGYSELIFNNGFMSMIYNWLNPTFIDKKDDIQSKLSKVNVDCEDISYIIMSHFHPDHIGGLNYFSKAKIVTSKEGARELKQKKLKSLIFKNMIPKDIESRMIENLDKKRTVKITNQLEGYDLFEDGEIILVNLKGHSIGQLGMLIKSINLFFVADSYWRIDELKENTKLKLIPRIIQNNYNEYEDTKQKLRELIKENPKIKLIASHEIVTDAEVQKYACETINITKLH